MGTANSATRRADSGLAAAEKEETVLHGIEYAVCAPPRLPWVRSLVTDHSETAPSAVVTHRADMAWTVGAGRFPFMMIRPQTLTAIKAGEVDLAFRRWDRPRVLVGTRLRTRVGLIEVTSVEQVAPSRITAADAKRAGAGSVAELRRMLEARSDRPVWRVGLRHAGADPREALRSTPPDTAEVTAIRGRLDRFDAASSIGPWTRATLGIIDHSPTVRAPDLAAELGRDTPSFKRDVRKLKELGLTESLDIGYRLSPRGAAVVDAESTTPRPDRPAPPTGTPLPRIGAPATRALRGQGIWTLEQVRDLSQSQLSALHGVGPVAVQFLTQALSDNGWAFAD